MPNYYKKLLNSPVGQLTLIASDQALLALLWENDSLNRVRQPLNIQEKNNAILTEASEQLNEYFSGQRQQFDLPVQFSGTSFQNKVWHALTKIPFGHTQSYSQLAQNIGAPKAVRAVGLANSKNPISIIVPCHRVIGKNGSLTGFAGGLDKKQRLLKLESQQSLLAV